MNKNSNVTKNKILFITDQSSSTFFLVSKLMFLSQSLVLQPAYKQITIRAAMHVK